jgi:hypothetical protein
MLADFFNEWRTGVYELEEKQRIKEYVLADDDSQRREIKLFTEGKTAPGNGFQQISYGNETSFCCVKRHQE